MPAVQKAAAGVAASQTKGRPKGRGKRKAESDAESGERRWSSYVTDQGCICKVKKTGMCMCHKWVILALMCCLEGLQGISRDQGLSAIPSLSHFGGVGFTNP